MYKEVAMWGVEAWQLLKQDKDWGPLLWGPQNTPEAGGPPSHTAWNWGRDHRGAASCWAEPWVFSRLSLKCPLAYTKLKGEQKDHRVSNVCNHGENAGVGHSGFWPKVPSVSPGLRSPFPLKSTEQVTIRTLGKHPLSCRSCFPREAAKHTSTLVILWEDVNWYKLGFSIIASL